VGADQGRADQVVGVSRRGVLVALLVPVLIVNVANAMTLLVDDTPGDAWMVLGRERNAATWVATALLALAAVAAWAVGRGRDDHRNWNLTAGVLLALSVDEVGRFHERFGELPRPPYVGDRAWSSFALVLVSIVAVRLLPWVLRLDVPLRRSILLGAVLFVGGSVGLDFLGGEWEQDHAHDAIFWIAETVEENLEMLGVLMVISGIVVEGVTDRQSVMFRFEPGSRAQASGVPQRSRKATSES
jgi:hypothetical protein